MSADDLRITLRVERAPGTDADLLRIEATLENLGSEPIATGVFASQLLVNGAPDPSWRLAMNGTMEPDLVELPPGRTAELVRDLRIGALRPGPNELEVRLGGARSGAVSVDLP